MAEATDIDTQSNGINAVMNASQDAAEKARVTAQRAADKLPDAVASVQTAATGTQRWLDQMPDDGLIIGTSFSLGMGVALFLSGANRLLVIAALAPAAATLLTILGRGNQTPSRLAAAKK